MNSASDILALNDWSPETFRHALADLRRVEEGDSSPDLEQSVTRTMKMLAAHLTQMRLFGRVSILRGYATMLGELLMRHPALPRLRDLTFSQRVGARLELMLEDLLQAEAVPSVDKAIAVLSGPKATGRLNMMRELVELDDWVDTAHLIKVSGTTKQNVHLAMKMFKKLGLVIGREANGSNLYRCTDLAKRTIAQLADRPLSIFNAIGRDAEPLDVGIGDLCDVMSRAAAY